MKSAGAIEPPISFSPRGVTKQIIIGDQEKLRDIITREFSVWSAFGRDIPSLHMGVSQAVQAQVQWASSLQQQANFYLGSPDQPQGMNGLAQLRNLLKQTEQGPILWSASKEAVSIINLMKENPLAAGIRLSRWAGTQGARQPQQLDINATRAVILDYLEDSDLRKSIKTFDTLFTNQEQCFQEVINRAKANLSGLADELAVAVANAKKNRDDVLQAGQEIIANLESSSSALANSTKIEIDSLKSHIEDLRKSSSDKIRGLLEITQIDIDNFRAALRSELRLQAPIAYWKEKARIHSRSRMFAFASFALAGAVLIGFSILKGPELLAGLPKDKDGGIFLGEVVVFTLPAVAYLWFMRFLGRFILSNGAAAEDAMLRATMTETFLALAADGQSGIADAERLIILQALFRSNSGSTEDDAPPPNLLEIIRSVSSK